MCVDGTHDRQQLPGCMIHPPYFIHSVHSLLERKAGALADGRRHFAGLSIQRFRGFCGLELLDTSLEVHLLGLLVWGELGALGDQRLVLLRRRLQLGSDIGRRLLVARLSRLGGRGKGWLSSCGRLRLL